MGIAKRIIQFDLTAFDWVEIEDERGVTYRYDKKGPAPEFSIVHVDFPGMHYRRRIGALAAKGRRMETALAWTGRRGQLPGYPDILARY